MWEQILPIVLNVGANLLGASIGNNAADDEKDAAQAANAQSLALARENRDIGLKLNQPFYQGSGNAFNLLSNIYGLPSQNFTYPTVGNLSTSGQPISANLGAGQPVQGHSGGGGSNAFTSTLGAILGSGFLGGPLGGLVGGALGGLVRNGGDNWTTLATEAPAGFDYGAYMQQPDLAAEWAKPDVQSLFNGNQDAYANWHYNKFGKTEGRTLNPMADTKTTQPVGGAQAGEQANGFSTTQDPMQLFWNSPHGKLATDQFLTIDNPGIKSAFATQGKALSGAQQIALSDRGRATAGNAFGNYERGVQRLAGYGPEANSTAQNSNNAFTNTAIGAAQGNGAAAGTASAARNNNWTNAFNNSVQYGYQAGKDAKWW